MRQVRGTGVAYYLYRDDRYSWPREEIVSTALKKNLCRLFFLFQSRPFSFIQVRIYGQNLRQSMRSTPPVQSPSFKRALSGLWTLLFSESQEIQQ